MDNSRLSIIDRGWDTKGRLKTKYQSDGEAKNQKNKGWIVLDAAVDLLIGGLLLSFQSVVRRLPHKHALKRVEGPRRLKDRRDSEKKGFNFKLSRIISLEFSYSTRFACLSDF